MERRLSNVSIFYDLSFDVINIPLESLCMWSRLVSWDSSTLLLISEIVHVDILATTTTYLWSRKWQPTSVFLPGKSHGQKSLVDYGPWGCKESDMTWWLNNNSIGGIWEQSGLQSWDVVPKYQAYKTDVKPKTFNWQSLIILVRLNSYLYL